MIEFNDFFTDIIQLYYIPVILAIVFIIVIVRDTLLQSQEKAYFLMGIITIFVIMTAVIIDNTIRAYGEGEVLVAIRRVTSSLQYGLSPFVPICILFTYASSLDIKLPKAIFIPALFDLVVSIISIQTGWIFEITPFNGYRSGPIHFLPIAISIGYYGLCVVFAFRNKVAGRANEKYTLIGLALFIGGAYAFETIMGRSHLVWPACIVAMVIYYMIRQVDVFQYDALTGAKNRRLYEDFIEKCKNTQDATFAFVDMNNLKEMNDDKGHDTGDKALKTLAKGLLSIRIHKSNVYRIGGDEFVIAGFGNYAEELERRLGELRERIGSVKGINISFAQAVMEYKSSMNIRAFLQLLDDMMYQDKKNIKRAVNRTDLST